MRQQADADLAQAVQLILAAVGAPEEAQVVINADGSMVIQTNDKNTATEE